MARRGARETEAADRAAPGSPASVSRAELLLSGSSSQELVDAIARWSEQQWQARAVRLWAGDRQGMRLLAASGPEPDEDDLVAAHTALADCAPSDDGHRVCQPIVVAHGAAAVLQLRFDRVEVIERHEQMARVGALLAQRLPAALELERLHYAVTQLAEAERLQRALFAIADLASSQRDMGDVLASLHTIVAGLMYARNFFIALLDRDREHIEFPYLRDDADPSPPLPGVAYRMEQMQGSLTARVIETGETLMGPSSALVAQLGCEESGFGPQSVDWLGVALDSDGDIVGAVVVQSYDERYRYSEKDRALLTFVAQHIATALQRRRAQSELEWRVALRTEELRQANEALLLEVGERERGEQLQAALFRIAELGATSGSLEEFHAAVHRIVGRLLYANNFYVAMLSEDGTEITFPYSVDEFDGERPTRKLGRGLTEYVLRSGKALLADRETNRALHEAGQIATQGARSSIWLGVPLVCESGTVGVLAVQSYDALQGYTQRDQEILTFVAYHIANALERKRAAERLREANLELERRVDERTEALYSANRDLHKQIAERQRFERQLQYAASHDSLTGLPNRAHFLQQLGAALARTKRSEQASCAVLFLDLDRFKVINDSVGHLVGDELLKEAGARIASVVASHGLLARLGGDEFAVLIEPLVNDAAAVALAERIISALDAPIRAGGKELFTATSIGIAVSRRHYRRAEDLLRDADVALYRAKARGRRRHEVFDETLRREALHQLDLEGSLRRGVVRGEFEPVYQPIVVLDGGAVNGYEALMRWRHPQRGLLAPPEFLAIAEESGLAEAMDWQVYELVFAQAAALVSRGGYLSINVGARHFRSNRFVPDLLQLTERYEFAPESLRVEVTERTLLEDPELARTQMQALRRAGVYLALDDFGTGYSSLSYLHQFPLTGLKVDRSFVLALEGDSRRSAHAVLRAICTLGRSLDMEVIAEGVETELQRDTLRGLGCDLGQGYLYSRPKPLAELLESRLSTLTAAG
jgi:diguanylate cyclase (GGDEF)-like protein